MTELKIARIQFRQNLTSAERAEIRERFAGCVCCVADIIKQGIDMTYQDAAALRKHWSKYAELITL